MKETMAVQLEWKEEYEIGDPTIDQEHKELFLIANSLFKIRNPHAEMGRYQAVIKDLFFYMKKHFSHEEKIMAANDFAGFPEHLKEHQDLIKEINSILKGNQAEETILHLAEMLHHWATVHIVEKDLQLKPYMNPSIDPPNEPEN